VTTWDSVTAYYVGEAADKEMNENETNHQEGLELQKTTKLTDPKYRFANHPAIKGCFHTGKNKQG